MNTFAPEPESVVVPDPVSEETGADDGTTLLLLLS
jgi:hypothetical protein